MSTTFPDSPALLDSTGQVIAQKLQGIINALGGGGGTVIIEEYDSSVLRYPNSNEDGGYTYKVGDYCSNNNSIYFCNTPITWNSSTPPEFDATKWYDATDDIVKELSKKPGIVIASGSSPEFIELFGNIGTHTIYNSGHGFAHVEGYNNTLGVSDDSSKSAMYSHVEGSNNVSGGFSSHAEGYTSKALAYASHAEGYGCESTGQYCHSEGNSSKATGSTSHAEGSGTTSRGDYSHTEGSSTYAYGNYSHAEGNSTITGKSTDPASYSYGYSSHAEGYGTQAIGKYSHAEGYYTTAGNANSSNAEACHAEGYYTTASAPYSHAEGKNCTCSAAYSHVEGEYCNANGAYNHVEGASQTVYGGYNHAEGQNNRFDSTNSPAYCHVEGQSNSLNGNNNLGCSYCHVEGRNNSIYGSNFSHVEGDSNYVYASYAHAQGQYCYANATYSHAGGLSSYAGAYGRQDASMSFAHGHGINVNNYGEAGFGTYNNSRDAKAYIHLYEESGTSYTTGDQVRYEGTVYTALEDITAPAGAFDSTKWDAGASYATNPTLFSVGNGSSSRSNAFELLRDGTAYLKNDKRIITTEEVPDPPSTDGTYILQVTVNNGVLTYSWV